MELSANIQINRNALKSDKQAIVDRLSGEYEVFDLELKGLKCDDKRERKAERHRLLDTFWSNRRLRKFRRREMKAVRKQRDNKKADALITIQRGVEEI